MDKYVVVSEIKELAPQFAYKLKTSLGTALFSHSGGTASYYLNISSRRNVLTSVVVICSYVLR